MSAMAHTSGSCPQPHILESSLEHEGIAAPELELQVWVLGSKAGSSERAAGALNSRAMAPAPSVCTED